MSRARKLPQGTFTLGEFRAQMYSLDKGKWKTRVVGLIIGPLVVHEARGYAVALNSAAAPSFRISHAATGYQVATLSTLSAACVAATLLSEESWTGVDTENPPKSLWVAVQAALRAVAYLEKTQ